MSTVNEQQNDSHGRTSLRMWWKGTLQKGLRTRTRERDWHDHIRKAHFSVLWHRDGRGRAGGWLWGVIMVFGAFHFSAGHWFISNPNY